MLSIDEFLLFVNWDFKGAIGGFKAGLISFVQELVNVGGFSNTIFNSLKLVILLLLFILLLSLFVVLKLGDNLFDVDALKNTLKKIFIRKFIVFSVNYPFLKNFFLILSYNKKNVLKILITPFKNFYIKFDIFLKFYFFDIINSPFKIGNKKI